MSEREKTAGKSPTEVRAELPATMRGIENLVDELCQEPFEVEAEYVDTEHLRERLRLFVRHPRQP